MNYLKKLDQTNTAGVTMADDLDDFFNEVEEAAAEAVKEEDDDEKEDDEPTDQQQEESTTDEAVDDEPPKKRTKVVAAASAASAPPIRPRGVVVAASSSVVTNKPVPVATEPSHRNINSDYHHTNTYGNNNYNTNIGPAMPSYNMGANNLPPLPPGPVPPPPPPTGASTALPIPTNGVGDTSTSNKKPVKRVAAGKVWVDTSLAEWPENDFRIFVGNLSPEVTDTQLYEHFQKLYASTAMAKIVKDKTGQTKGFGFVSFLQPLDCAKAIREQDQKWLGSRPIRVKRSDWKDRNLNTVQKKQKKESKKQKRLGGF